MSIPEEPIERAARGMCKAKGRDPDQCVSGSGSISSPFTQCFRYAWQDELQAAHAALEASALFAAGRIAEATEIYNVVLASLSEWNDPAYNQACDFIINRIVARIAELQREGGG